MLKLFLLLSKFFFVFSTPVERFLKETTCQKACHPLVDGKINVHLIPHSHDDVGWVKTYDQYYSETGGVSYILNSTIQALKKNEDRRYIQVETAFFWKWWNDQPNKIRDLVKDMVNKDQLEMVNGGWSMNDEGASNYQSIIDQFTWGFRILEDTVGECGRPKIGWQIDPFGHSREHAFIVKQLGFDGLVLGRIDFKDKEQRITDKNLDFVWNTNDNFAEDEAQIFTTMFPNFYTYEEGFCFDVNCYDPELNDQNLKQKVNLFKQILDKYKSYYKTSNIMIPMGHDFSYQKADKNFDNTDKLIQGFKGDETYNVIYSTPSCYIQAVKNEVAKNQIELTVKTDDFFPYASKIHTYWSGYFTSRPTSKKFERVGNNILQSSKQLTTFSRIKGNDDDKNILDLRMAMGVMQHHDAITGTEKQAVANDYAFILDEAIKKTEKPVSNIILDLLKKEESASIDLKFSHCLLSNVSYCINSEEDRFVVAVYNLLSTTVSHYVRIPAGKLNYKITGPEEDGEVPHDIFLAFTPFLFLPNYVNPALTELVFLAKDIPPLGVKLYHIEKLDGTSDAYHPYLPVENQQSFGDEKSNGYTIDDKGKLETVTLNGQTLNISQDFYFYKGYADSSNNEDQQSSGAYIFRPDGEAQKVTDTIGGLLYAKGTLVDEVYQMFDDRRVFQTIRVYKGKNDAYLEFKWMVGDLQWSAEGTEVITRFQIADFDNKDVFYTDSNGRQQIKRVKKANTDEPISSNYYPVTSRIVIRDESKQLEVAVINDRSQGGSSLAEGMIELMVHRRATKDDGLGVSEVLNETQYNELGLYATGQHYLTFGTTKDGEQGPIVLERNLALQQILAPVILVAKSKYNLATTQNLLNFKFEGLKKALPDNIRILTLEPWKDSYILRLEHIFEKGEDQKLSTDTSIDLTVLLKDLFTLFNITELTPVMLGANQNLEPTSKTLLDGDLKITLKPMEIKTFIFKTDKNNDGGQENGISENENDGDDDDDNGSDDDNDGSNRVEALTTVPVLSFLTIMFTRNLF